MIDGGRESYLYEPMVPVVELRGAWTGITYSWRIL